MRVRVRVCVCACACACVCVRHASTPAGPSCAWAFVWTGIYLLFTVFTAATHRLAPGLWFGQVVGGREEQRRRRIAGEEEDESLLYFTSCLFTLLVALLY